MTPPLVYNGLEHSHCVPQANGSTCTPQCQPGFAWSPGSGAIVCLDGAFVVNGACILEGAKPLLGEVAEVIIDIVASDPIGNNSAEAVDTAWAMANRALLVQAAAASLGISPRLVRVEVLPVSFNNAALNAPRRRRLQEDVCLAMANITLESGAAGARRLTGMPDGPVLFQLRVLVILSEGGLPLRVLESGNSTAEVYRMMGKLLSANGSINVGWDSYCAVGEPGHGIVDTIGTELTLRNEVEPAILQNSVAAMEGAVQIRGAFMLEVLEWLERPFEPCPTTCGQGVQSRSVVCSSGVGQCDEFVEPASIRSCADYSGCASSLDILCPAGQDDCETQRASVITTLVLAPMACLGCFYCLREVRRRRRSQAAFLQRPDKPSLECDKGGNAGDTSPEDSITSTAYWSGGMVDTPCSSLDRAFHISWDIDLVHVSSRFGRGPQNASPWISPRSTVKAAADVAEQDIELALDDPAGPFTSPVRPLERMPLQPLVLPAYPSNTRVEFYSKSNAQWMSGVLTFTTTTAGTETSCVYHVRLSNGQVRREIPLDLLRLPLNAGEDVQVYQGDGWLDGKVIGTSYIDGEDIVYEVKTQENSSMPERDGGENDSDVDAVTVSVPAHYVRRVFPRHSIVNVYQGPKEGWSVAMVHFQPGHVSQNEAEDRDGNVLMDNPPNASEDWRGAPVTVRFALMGTPRPRQIETFPAHLVRRGQDALTL